MSQQPVRGDIIPGLSFDLFMDALDGRRVNRLLEIMGGCPGAKTAGEACDRLGIEVGDVLAGAA